MRNVLYDIFVLSIVFIAMFVICFAIHMIGWEFVSWGEAVWDMSQWSNEHRMAHLLASSIITFYAFVVIWKC